MKKLNIFFLLTLFFYCVTSYAQVYYDNFPTTVPSNANAGEFIKLKGDEPVTNFVPIGTNWDDRIITYFFQNGTADIAGNDERGGYRCLYRG